MAAEPRRLRAVLDTNVILAALLSRNPRSPTLEILHRWRRGEFDLLYCPDLLVEYQEKLTEKGIREARTEWFLQGLLDKGILVHLTPGEVLPRVPDDPDDDVVLACALVGGATHLVTYDPHLLSLDDEYEELRILDGLHFLYALRGDQPPTES